MTSLQTVSAAAWPLLRTTAMTPMSWMPARRGSCDASTPAVWFAGLLLESLRNSSHLDPTPTGGRIARRRRPPLPTAGKQALLDHRPILVSSYQPSSNACPVSVPRYIHVSTSGLTLRLEPPPYETYPFSWAAKQRHHQAGTRKRGGGLAGTTLKPRQPASRHRRGKEQSRDS